MPALDPARPRGELRPGWTAAVDDYAIAGAWTLGGELLVVADAAGGVHAFDATTGAPRWTRREAHPGGALALAASPEGAALATAGQDGRVLLWEPAEGRSRCVLDVGASRRWVEHLAWSPGGRWLAAAAGRAAHVVAIDGAEVWRSDEHPSTVSAVAWAGPDELATACYGRVRFFELPAGRETQRLEWKGSLVSMVLSPGGDVVACGSQDNTVHFWRRSTGQDSMMSGYPGKPAALAFDPSGTLLATGGGEAVTVWSFHGKGPEGTEPGVLSLHVQPVTALAFAPRGTRLASGGRDGAVVLWTLRRDGHGRSTGAALVPDAVAALCWRPDGRTLAALDASGGVTVWRAA